MIRCTTVNEIDWAAVMEGKVMYVEEPIPRVIVECPGCHIRAVSFPPVPNDKNGKSDFEYGREVCDQICVNEVAGLVTITCMVHCRSCGVAFTVLNDKVTIQC